jgi:hypothetical protein
MLKQAINFVLSRSTPSTYEDDCTPRGSRRLAALLTGPFDDPIRGEIQKDMRFVTILFSVLLHVLPVNAYAIVGDEATHESDHQEDVLEVPEVHVHGLPLNKDQQLGPVPKSTPWPGIPPSLDGKVVDDWMKARLLVSREAKVTVVILEPCKHRELTVSGITALAKWTFDPQMQGDLPIDGELTVRIHFRTR